MRGLWEAEFFSSLLRLRQAIPGQPGLRTQPAKGLVRNVIQAGVEEGILFPGLLTAGFEVGNDSAED